MKLAVALFCPQLKHTIDKAPYSTAVLDLSQKEEINTHTTPTEGKAQSNNDNIAMYRETKKISFERDQDFS